MKNLHRQWAVSALVLAFLLPAAARATITFKQLDEGMFVVSHRVKLIGSRGQAMDLAYTKAASLCVAAGYSHFEILQQESEAGQADDSANASVRVRFYFEGGGDRIDCSRNADAKYVQQAQDKLKKQGYTSPARAAAAVRTDAASQAPSADGCAISCSIEQIAAMARSGLSDEKIRAACVDDG